MRFQKWQALGNDYVIVEATDLPFELTAGRVRHICDPHFGIGADGILLLSGPADAANVASLRIFNPDGSEAELSGNGAREAVMYLRAQGWTGEDRFTIETAAGPVSPEILSDTECRVDMGHARLQSTAYPEGAPDGRGRLEAEGRAWDFQHVSIGNPQCAIFVATEAELAALDLPAIGPAIEHHGLFPQRTNVSWFTETAPGRIRARIFERGVGETLSSGTGATGAAVAYVQRGGEGRVAPGVIITLDGGELVAEIAPDLRVHLTGWAVPICSGTLSDTLIKELT